MGNLEKPPSDKDVVFRYVWLDMNTGKFSNSWDEEMQKTLNEDDFKIANTKNFKLLKYQCLSDENFEFYNMMRLA